MVMPIVSMSMSGVFMPRFVVVVVVVVVVVGIAFSVLMFMSLLVAMVVSILMLVSTRMPVFVVVVEIVIVRVLVLMFMPMVVVMVVIATFMVVLMVFSMLGIVTGFGIMLAGNRLAIAFRVNWKRSSALVKDFLLDVGWKRNRFGRIQMMMRRYCMWNQMQKCIAKKSTNSESNKNF